MECLVHNTVVADITRMVRMRGRRAFRDYTLCPRECRNHGGGREGERERGVCILDKGEKGMGDGPGGRGTNCNHYSRLTLGWWCAQRTIVYEMIMARLWEWRG